MEVGPPPPCEQALSALSLKTMLNRNNMYSSTALLPQDFIVNYKFYSENASATSNIFNFFCVSLGERTKAALWVSFPGRAIDAPPQRRNLVVTRTKATNRRVIVGGNCENIATISYSFSRKKMCR